jgi:ribonuclease HII
LTPRFPDLHEELALQATGHQYIAGIDEAGRGAWAGPVAAAAVILPVGDAGLPARLGQVRDSKLCSPRLREALVDQIMGEAVSWGVALVPALRIDEVGIVAATREAMCRAVARLQPVPDALLIDALALPSLALPQQVLPKADLKCLSVAAASILAKVERDRVMVALADAYPDYGFAQHKGYGTRRHRHALHAHGPTESHRWYYGPVAEVARRLGVATDRPTYRRKSAR